MFGIPDAKRCVTASVTYLSTYYYSLCADKCSCRVRREDLDDASSDDSDVAPDDRYVAHLRARLTEQLAGSLALSGLDVPVAAAHADAANHKPADQRPSTDADAGATPDAEEFEFRLFKSDKPLAKIVIADDRPRRPGEGGFVVPSRPLSHYLAPPVTLARKSQFAAAALSGDDVIAMSKRRWWGMEMAWRVTHITLPVRRRATGTAEAEPPEGAESARRKRPGKKKRLAARTKHRGEETAKEVAWKNAAAKETEKASKEERLQQKKKRLNREKKIKRRAKEREKKLAAKTADGTAELVSDDSGSESAT